MSSYEWTAFVVQLYGVRLSHYTKKIYAIKMPLNLKAVNEVLGQFGGADLFAPPFHRDISIYSPPDKRNASKWTP